MFFGGASFVLEVLRLFLGGNVRFPRQRPGESSILGWMEVVGKHGEGDKKEVYHPLEA